MMTQPAPCKLYSSYSSVYVSWTIEGVVDQYCPSCVIVTLHGVIYHCFLHAGNPI